MNMSHETPPPIPQNHDIPHNPDFMVPPEGQMPLGGYSSIEAQTTGQTPLSEIIARNRQPGATAENQQIFNGNTDTDTTESPKLDIKSELGIQIGIYKELGALARFGLEKAGDKAATKLGELAEKRQVRKEAGIESRSEKIGKIAKKMGRVAVRRTVAAGKNAKNTLKEKGEERSEKKEERQSKRLKKNNPEWRDDPDLSPKERIKHLRKEDRKKRKIAKDLANNSQSNTIPGTPLKEIHSADNITSRRKARVQEQVNTQASRLAVFNASISELDSDPRDADRETFEDLLGKPEFVLIMADLRELVDAAPDKSRENMRDLVLSSLSSNYYGRFQVHELELFEPDTLNCVFALLESDHERFESVFTPEFLQKQRIEYSKKSRIRLSKESANVADSADILLDFQEIQDSYPEDGSEDEDIEDDSDGPVSFAGKKIVEPQSPPPFIPQPSNTESSDQDDDSEKSQASLTPPPFDMSKLSGPLLKDVDESLTDEPKDDDEDFDDAPSTAGNPEFDDSANNAAYFAAQRLREQNQSRRRGGRRY